MFAHLALEYRHRPAAFDHYPEPELNEILRGYAATLDRTTILFPSAAIRCVDRLAALSGGRLLLVSGDRGDVDEAGLRGRGDPDVAVHGSFSLPVNYHALGRWFAGRGGEMLTTTHEQVSLQVPAFLLGVPPERRAETRLAYRLAFEGPSPDDFFRLRQGVQAHYGLLDVTHILSLLRLSCHDPRILRDCLPALVQQAHSLGEPQRAALLAAVERVLQNYFHIGEERDLLFDVAVFVHLLGDAAAALRLFAESRRLYGDDPRTCWNMAMCAFALGQPDAGQRHLAEVWAVAPDFVPGLGLLMKD
ncbi:MAG: tetratricopeptide repeat protein [Minicystis sp.]